MDMFKFFTKLQKETALDRSSSKSYTIFESEVLEYFYKLFPVVILISNEIYYKNIISLEPNNFLNLRLRISKYRDSIEFDIYHECKIPFWLLPKKLKKFDSSRNFILRKNSHGNLRENEFEKLKQEVLHYIERFRKVEYLFDEKEEILKRYFRIVEALTRKYYSEITKGVYFQPDHFLPFKGHSLKIINERKSAKRTSSASKMYGFENVREEIMLLKEKLLNFYGKRLKEIEIDGDGLLKIQIDEYQIKYYVNGEAYLYCNENFVLLLPKDTRYPEEVNFFKTYHYDNFIKQNKSVQDLLNEKRN